jgi:DNA-binding IclR family transcriptional regulator
MARPHISLTVRCLNCIQTAHTPLRVVEIARKVNRPCNTVRVILLRLCDRNAITATRTDQGVRYSPITSSTDESSTPKIWDVTRTWSTR